jgi:outer membrane protein TolC
MNSLYFSLLGTLVSATALLAEEPILVSRELLSELRAEAARSHPAVAAANARAAAALLDVNGVRLWDDPTVGLSVMIADRMMRRDDGDIRLSFEQPLPRRGLFDATRDKAAALGRAERETARTSRQTIAATAAKNAIELALADEAIILQAAQIEWLKTMAENARQQAANPDASAASGLRLETELAREQQILKAAQRSRESMAQRLNLSLGRPLDRPWPPLRLPADPGPVPVPEAEVARVAYSNPRVRALREMAGAAAAETRVANQEQKPQFTVGVDSSLYSGGDLRSIDVGIKMTLPWFNEPTYRARVESAASRERAAGSDIEAARLEVAAEVLAAATEAANAAEQAHAYSGEIHERATQARQSIEAAWISATATLADLLESNRALFSIRLEQRRFIAIQAAATEDLNALVPPPSSSSK